MAESTETKPLRTLLQALSSDAFRLLELTMALARAELTAAGRAAGLRAAVMVAGALVVVAGLLVLVAAAVLAAVELGLRPWLGALLVGALAVAGGAFTVQRALAGSRIGRLVPAATVQSLKEDAAWLKAQTRK